MSDTLQQRRMLEAATMWRESWRIMPFLTLAYLLCYIDRVNVGFASLQMNKAVGIDPSEQPESDLRARWNPLWRFRWVWHNALPLMWMVLAMGGTFFAVSNLWITNVLLTLIAAGTYASKGPFWALSSEWLGPTAAAAGLAQINALGNLSGFFFNYSIGWIKDETGSFPIALMPIAAVATIGTICVLTIGRNQPRTLPVTA